MKIFITGTDTDVGKTYVTAALTSLLLKQGLHVGVIKWVGTGGGKGGQGMSPDMEYVLEKASMASLAPGSRLSVSCPYTFSFPASPHLASALENRQIDPDVIMKSTQRLEKDCNIVLIEGVGGLMVPLTNELLLVDLIKEAACPVILVARSGLGTINHTLLSLTHLKREEIAVEAVVMNSIGYAGAADDTDEKIVKDNLIVISRFAKCPVYGPLPFGPKPVNKEVAQILAPLSAAITGQHPSPS